MGPFFVVFLIPFAYLMAVTFVYMSPVLIACTIAFVVLRGMSEAACSQIKRSHMYATLQPIFRQALPPSKEEAEALVLHAQVQAKIEAEIDDALQIAQNMPKTFAEAQWRLTEAKEKVNALEARVALLVSRANAQSGGWADVCETRSHLEQAERDLTEAFEDRERFPKQISAGAGFSENWKAPFMNDPPKGSIAEGTITYADAGPNKRCELWQLLHARSSSDHAVAALSGARSMSSSSNIRQMMHWPPIAMRPVFQPLQKPLPASVLRSIRSPAVRNCGLGLAGRPLLTALRRL